ncbi:epidermal growth factor receptor substrate 15-like 1 isoform X2 [Microplitis mediator]|uniref:epidermal growth factor receptor substrate 15-like 1 isoform X2 n=1 Tax=Microplitis mediator TaxID=375433 RepID=UPI0025541B8F|nr:epidermal growth factor receptor substrate 15-like 1 isoform X2 [Microplitis mediator]
MAALPSPTQVAGSHEAIYEAYYNQADPKGCGRIEAMDAARFLKKSQLSDVILSKIWDMADPQSRGSLDKTGMFVALKLCAFAQAGRELNIANLSQDIPPPKMGDIKPVVKKTPAVPPPPVISAVISSDWSIKPHERIKYDRLFDDLHPTNGYIPGNQVKGLLMDSKLPMETLGKIWDLADIDKDGMLDRHEFVVAMHLVYKALEKHAIPSVLPPELMPAGKRKEAPLIADLPAPAMVAAPIPPIPPLPNASAINNLVGLQSVKPPPQQQHVQWVVSVEDQAAADKLFLQADMDMDGFVSGTEIKDVFLQSGLPQTILAHIWALCDLGQSGKLNKEQFALSMWLIKQKLRGIDPPTALTPEMIPPSLRKFTDGGVAENNNVPTYSNPELDMISKDIADLARERRLMEQDIAQKEADIKIKNGEIKSLQSELDTLAATLKQLENQRGEAQKRLNDLKAQVDKLRQQAEEQESVLKTQEDELNSKRQELEGLRQEEQQLEQQQNTSRDQLNELTKNLQNTQLQISQAKAKITHLEEQQRQMTDVIAIYDSALAAGDPNLVPDTSLQFNPEINAPEFENESLTKLNGLENENQGTKAVNSFIGMNGSSDGFENQNDPFTSNKAKDTFGNSEGDPFTNFDGRRISSGFASDPFAAKSKEDSYDPFGDNKRNEKPATETAKDPFGDDPFANLHAPTRAESPSPALPPKKAKQPPPRPAPPRPASGPTGPLRAAPVPPTPSPTPDPFSNSNSDPFAAQNDNNNGNPGFGSTATGFADFANFDAKPDLQPTRTAPARPISRPRATPTPTQKLPDFTEDPFRDYRYEDPFEIADPFADEDDANANKKSQGNINTNGRKLDPFGFETTATPGNNSFADNDPFEKGFDSDFSKAFSSIKENTDKVDNFMTDTKNNSFKSINEFDFSNNSITETTRPINKPINFDEAFAPRKNEKNINYSDRNTAQVFEDMFTNDNTHSNKNNNGNATWNGRNNVSKALSEQQQLAWASQQSLRAEEERSRRKAQEEADFAYAIELSKQENAGKF